MHNGFLIPPDEELLMDHFLSQPSWLVEMSCPHISHSDFFSPGFPLTAFSKLLGSGHPGLVSLVTSLCHQSCRGWRHRPSEDKLTAAARAYSSVEKPQPSHPEGEVGTGTSPGPQGLAQSDLTALLGEVFTPGLHPAASVLLGRTEPSVQVPSMQFVCFA